MARVRGARSSLKPEPRQLGDVRNLLVDIVPIHAVLTIQRNACMFLCMFLFFGAIVTVRPVLGE